MVDNSAQARWDAIYSDAPRICGADPFVTESDFLPEAPCTVLDVAGGKGATALWFAGKGYDTTLLDVSEVALDIASQEADLRDVELITFHHDLESGPPLTGKWDVIVCANFLDRGFYATLREHLNPDGIAFLRVATATNLERNSKPSRRFLVEIGELPELLFDLEPLSFTEDWFDGRHEARMICRRV